MTKTIIRYDPSFVRKDSDILVSVSINKDIKLKMNWGLFTYLYY